MTQGTRAEREMAALIRQTQKKVADLHPKPRVMEREEKKDELSGIIRVLREVAKIYRK